MITKALVVARNLRGDLTLIYFTVFNSLTGHLIDLELAPLQIRRFQLVPASGADILWLRRTLDRESGRFGVHIKLKPDGRSDRITARSRLLMASALVSGRHSDHS